MIEYDFDYSLVRGAGIPLLTLGGTSTGPGPLKELHGLFKELFEKKLGETFSTRDIVDIMNLLGKCIITGTKRRVAEIALGGAYDNEFIALKDY